MGFTSGPISSCSRRPQHSTYRGKHRKCKKTMMSKAIKLQKWRDLSLLRHPIKTTLRPLHEGPDTVEQLLVRHVTKNRPSTSSVQEEEEQLARRRLTSTRREALGLYRDILRAKRFFLWTDARGVPWRDALRENARKEFEEARFEKDPEVVTRLLIGGRNAVDSVLERLAEKQRIEIEKQRRGRTGSKNSIPKSLARVLLDAASYYY